MAELRKHRNIRRPMRLLVLMGFGAYFGTTCVGPILFAETRKNGSDPVVRDYCDVAGGLVGAFLGIVLHLAWQSLSIPQLTPRTRRIVRRSVITVVAAIVLLPSAYISAWVLVSRAALQGHISRATAKNIAPTFAPIKTYCRDRRPGWKLLSRLWMGSMPEKVPNNGTAFHMMIWFAPPSPEERE